MLRRPSDLTAADFPIPPRPSGEFTAVEPLLALCASGKLYEVETWVAEGNPLQFPPPGDRKLRRRSTALQIAVERGFHSLAALLLANGYNPNGDYYECLSPAVRAKDRDMVDLLLRFGANAHSVDFCTVLESCDRVLMDRFIEAGVDPCRENAVARAIDSKRRPILGFVKQYRERFPGLQRQVDIALRAATESENLRSIALMLWLGGDPHAHVPGDAYIDEQENESGETAFERALWLNKPEVLTQFLKRPIPRESVESLLFSVSYRARPDLVRRLLNEGANPNALSEEGYPVMHGFITSLLWRHQRPSGEEYDRGIEALECLLKAGAKWSLDERQLKGLRRDLAEGESKFVVRLLDLLHQYDGISVDQLRELTRTPAVRKVLNGVSKPRQDFFRTYSAPPAVPSSAPQPPRGGYWKRHWSQR